MIMQNEVGCDPMRRWDPDIPMAEAQSRRRVVSVPVNIIKIMAVDGRWVAQKEARQNDKRQHDMK